MFGFSKPWGEKRSSVYAPVPLDDERDSGDSPTHVASSSQEIMELKQRIWRLKLWIRTILGLTFPGAALLLFLLSANVVRVQQLAPSTSILSPVPPIESTVVTFERDPRFAARPSPESDRAWNSLLPPGRGFVFVDDHEKYDMPPGEETRYGMIYSVALFHQIHCLGQLRKYYWIMLDGISNGDEHLKEHTSMLLEESGEHVHHCFDYLRQSILCNGDMSMEWPRTEPDGSRFAVDGWGIPHECKSFEGISEYMEQNHFNYSSNNEIAPH